MFPNNAQDNFWSAYGGHPPTCQSPVGPPPGFGATRPSDASANLGNGAGASGAFPQANAGAAGFAPPPFGSHCAGGQSTDGFVYQVDKYILLIQPTWPGWDFNNQPPLQRILEDLILDLLLDYVSKYNVFGPGPAPTTEPSEAVVEEIHEMEEVIENVGGSNATGAPTDAAATRPAWADNLNATEARYSSDPAPTEDGAADVATLENDGERSLVTDSVQEADTTEEEGTSEYSSEKHLTYSLTGSDGGASLAPSFTLLSNAEVAEDTSPAAQDEIQPNDDDDDAKTKASVTTKHDNVTAASSIPCPDGRIQSRIYDASPSPVPFGQDDDLSLSSFSDELLFPFDDIDVYTTPLLHRPPVIEKMSKALKTEAPSDETAEPENPFYAFLSTAAAAVGSCFCWTH